MIELAIDSSLDEVKCSHASELSTIKKTKWVLLVCLFCLKVYLLEEKKMLLEKIRLKMNNCFIILFLSYLNE